MPPPPPLKGGGARGGGGGVGTRPWWLALLACGSAYWPLALEPSAMTSRHPHGCGHPHCRGHPPAWGGGGSTMQLLPMASSPGGGGGPAPPPHPPVVLSFRGAEEPSYHICQMLS